MLASRPPYSSGQLSQTHRSRPSVRSKSTRSSTPSRRRGRRPRGARRVAHEVVGEPRAHLVAERRSAGLSQKSIWNGPVPDRSVIVATGRYPDSYAVAFPTTRTPGVRIEKLVVGPFENKRVRASVQVERRVGDRRRSQRARATARRQPGDRREPCAHDPRALGTTSRLVEAVAGGGQSTSASQPQDASIAPVVRTSTIPDDDVISVGDLRLRTIHTPRPHTGVPRAFCSRAGRCCSVGDTLFHRRPREHRPPRAGTSIRSSRSIDRRLFALPGDLLVLPGHCLDTTLDSERPHLQEWVDRGW